MHDLPAGTEVMQSYVPLHWTLQVGGALAGWGAPDSMGSGLGGGLGGGTRSPQRGLAIACDGATQHSSLPGGG